MTAATLFNVGSDFREVRELARLQFGIDKFSVDAYFKASAIGWDKGKFLDSGFQVSNQLIGQTDRFRFVVSNLAIDDFDFH